MYYTQEHVQKAGVEMSLRQMQRTLNEMKTTAKVFDNTNIIHTIEELLRGVNIALEQIKRTAQP